MKATPDKGYTVFTETVSESGRKWTIQIRLLRSALDLAIARSIEENQRDRTFIVGPFEVHLQVKL